MGEKLLGTFPGVRMIDLTGLDADFFILASTAQGKAVSIVATGPPHLVSRVKIRQERGSKGVRLFITDRSAAASAVGVTGSDIPLPRRRGPNIVVRRDPQGDSARSPIEKSLGSTPLSRKGGSALLLRIEAPEGTVVKY